VNPGTTTDELGALLARDRGPFRATSLTPGERFVHQDEHTDRVGYVLDGQVVLTAASAHGEEHASSVRGQGSLIGYDALLDAPSPFEIRALGRVELEVAEAAALERWARDEPDVAVAMAQALATEATRLAVERRMLLGPATHRVARFLIAREQNPLMEAWRTAPQHTVASMLSMRPETLSRALKGLHAQALVKDGPGRQLAVRDLEGLRRLVGERDDD